jgi:DNA (cytosine-5)-methyltransferase 1
VDVGVVDLFCGIGGLSYGFRREGFPVVAGIDTDARCAYAYEANTGARFLHRDVATVSPADVRALYRNGKARGERWRLLGAFADLVVGVEPDVVTMENVPQLLRHSEFARFVRALEGAGYWPTWYLARGPEYGVPQRRTRLVLFASRLGMIELLPPTHGPDDLPTVRQAIGRLPAIVAGGRDPRDKLHRARDLRAVNRSRIAATGPGGWWRDWDDSLKLACHRKASGATYRSVYGRMEWDRPAPTITTQCIGLGNGQFGHPEQDRAISLREAALLQTFPRRYRFTPPGADVPMHVAALQIGNAVPVRLGQIVARSIKRHLAACGALEAAAPKRVPRTRTAGGSRRAVDRAAGRTG